MQRWLRIVVVLLAALVAVQWWSNRSPDRGLPGPAPRAKRPAGRYAPRATRRSCRREAVATLEAIERGGPFRYDRDGSIVPESRAPACPEQPRGYYREYTVIRRARATAARAASSAAAIRPRSYYYTDDHYRSFRRVEVTPMSDRESSPPETAPGPCTRSR